MTVDSYALFREARPGVLAQWLFRNRTVWLFATLTLLHSAAGCGGSTNAQLNKYDPATATAKAMDAYDRNADAKLTADELKECPGFIEAGRRLDQNGDKTITAQEIDARFKKLDEGFDLIPLDLTVTAKGRPLVGAELTFTPEPFMGENLQSYKGTTTESGSCALKGTEVQLPGLPVGFYKVVVKHPGQKIDAVRGCEISDDLGNRLEIAL